MDNKLKNVCCVLITILLCAFLYSNCFEIQIFKNSAKNVDDAMQIVIVNKITKHAYWDIINRKNVVIVRNTQSSIETKSNFNNLDTQPDYSKMFDKELMSRILNSND